MAHSQSDIDTIKRLRALGASWRETSEATALSVHVCRRLARDGLVQKSWPAGSREWLTDKRGIKRNLRAMAIEWLTKHRPEQEQDRRRIYEALKLIRRRHEEGWPVHVIMRTPTMKKLEREHPAPIKLDDFAPEPAVVLGDPQFSRPVGPEWLIINRMLAEVI